MSQNNYVILVCGASTTGKSSSLEPLKNDIGIMYLNAESNKRLPFKHLFVDLNVTDPLQVNEAFEHVKERPDIHTLVIDSLTYLMDQYESQYVLGSANGMKAWGDYQQFFKKLMQQDVANSTKNIIFIAHTRSDLNEELGAMETKVPIKGALANQGVESYFSVIVATKRVPIKELADFTNPYLNITEEDTYNGYKYCFQTRLTKKTVNERIRSPMGMWSRQETFIDNNIQFLLDKLNQYYK